MSKSYQYHSEFSSYPSSAIQAKHLGKTYFFTGKPCTNGHLYLKYASSGNCVKCIEKRRGTVEINFRGKSSKRTIANQKLAELALINGFTTYTPIEPCKHGHKERYVGNNNCVQCNENSSKQRKEKIAIAGREAVLKSHTQVKRVDTILKEFRRWKNAAQVRWAWSFGRTLRSGQESGTDHSVSALEGIDQTRPALPACPSACRAQGRRGPAAHPGSSSAPCTKTCSSPGAKAVHGSSLVSGSVTTTAARWSGAVPFERSMRTSASRSEAQA